MLSLLLRVLAPLVAVAVGYGFAYGETRHGPERPERSPQDITEPMAPPPPPLPEEPLEDGADSAEAPVYRLALRLEADPENNSGTARGTMRIRGWRPAEGGRRCLYLPYNDPDYEFDPIRDFDLAPRRFAKPERIAGSQHAVLKTDGGTATELSPYIIEISGVAADAELVFEFTSELPRWPDADPDEWVFTDMHPQPLAACPDRPTDSRSFSFVPHAQIRATLAADEEWMVASPGLPIGGMPSGGAYDLRFAGRKLVVALLKGFSHRALPIPGTGIEVFYRDQEFEKLVPTMQNAVLVDTDIFGPPPFPHIVILETSDVEKSSLPGMIAVNRPRQAGMSEIQGDYLNWTDWQVTAFTAEQWFGAAVSVPSLDDLWLLRGFVDFATIESLANAPKRYTLFREEPGETSATLNFDYRQAQDLLAAALTYLHPYNALTDAHFENIDPFDKQHSLSYVRHALALRQLNWTIGRVRFRQLLRAFFAEARGRALRPKDFAQFLARNEPLAEGYLKQWWATDDWPDFQLLDVDDVAIPGRTGHQVQVTVGQRDGFSLPATVTVVDEGGKVYKADARPLPGHPDRWVSVLDTEQAPDRVEIDQEHQIFDWNRFDNSNAWPSFQFIPGNATTFADDAYTVLWLPLATQLPGQPLTYELVAQAFRYMHSSTTAVATYEPSTRTAGYQVYYLTDFPKLGSYMVADLIQDKGLAFEGERVQDVGMYKTVHVVKDPYIEYGLRLRNRQMIDDTASRHQTLALTTNITPLNQYGDCSYSAKAEFEEVVHAESDDFRYNRRFALAEGTCKVAPYLELGLRGFAGALTRVDNYTGGNFRFHPQDITEARMRFDEPTLDRADDITTVGADILVPAPLPVPDAFYILKRETKYRLFGDWGKSEAPEASYRDAGVGLWVPLGADLVGKGSVSVLNLSVLVVLYRQAGSYQSRAPGLLFDFDFFGKL